MSEQNEKEHWKKNGEVAFAISDKVYFTIVIFWFIGAFASGMVGIIIGWALQSVAIIGGSITIAIVWFVIEWWFVGDYLIRHYLSHDIPSGENY